MRIKWPNDLFVADRKVGGILMEVAGEQDEVDWVVLGIGINVNTEFIELPVALRRTATSLRIAGEQLVDRSSLLAALLLALESALRRCGRKRVREHRQRVPPERLPPAQKRERRDARGSGAG